MGCCFSSPDGPNSPYPGGGAAPSASARAINPPPSLPAPASVEESRPGSTPRTATTQTRRHHHHRPQQSLAQHIDKPLRRHEWVAPDRAWTRNDLDTERADFFDTRVTGRSEVWQVLRAALEILWENEMTRRTMGDSMRRRKSRTQQRRRRESEEDHGESRGSTEGGGAAESSDDGSDGSDDALATAQGILKAAEITLPTGDLSNGAYDSLGNYYPLPEWIVSDPNNIAEDSGAGRRRSDNEGHADEDGKCEIDHHKGGATADDDEDEGEAVRRRREEKGKSVLDVKKMVKVRARLSENYPDVMIGVGAEESVRSVARRIAEESGLPSTKRIRVAYMGKILKETMPLQSQGWQKGHVVNALVFSR